MKKLISIFLLVIITLSVFVGCGQSVSDSSVNIDTAKSKKLSVVTAIFPEYDWVKSIVGENDNVEITMLLDNGVDLHSYQPTAEDVVKISDCDLFIYVGGESDAWVNDALKNATNKDMKVINLLEVLGGSVKEEEVKEGMQAEDEEDGEDEEEPEYDEHVWLSLKNAKLFCKTISDTLSEIDFAHSELYSSNSEVYCNKLSQLDEKYSDTVDSAKRKTLLFGDRFPFRYLVDDYSLDYYAAFVGCSAETEASFETISFLSKKVDELKLPCVMTIEGTEHKIADTIVSNTSSKNQKILSMDSMQSTTSEDVKNGTTYLSVMEQNLKVLKTALN